VRTLADVLRRPGALLGRSLSAFRANQGLLLAGAVAYYTLLSLMPLMSLLLIGASHVVSEPDLLDVVSGTVARLLPDDQARALTEEVSSFLRHREVVGTFGFLVMLFFSSLAFRVLENAMSVVFYHRVVVEHRHFIVSALMPYIFMTLLGFGLVVVAGVSGYLQASNVLRGALGFLAYVVGFVGTALIITAIYLVMPVGRLTFSHALVGGVVAAVLWEIARHLLVWYFETLSIVNVIYGSLATVVIALLFLEVGGMILLFGAQVIAELERALKEDDGPPEAFKT
jgi:YihY family inner membrane protein